MTSWQLVCIHFNLQQVYLITRSVNEGLASQQGILSTLSTALLITCTRPFFSSPCSMFLVLGLIIP